MKANQYFLIVISALMLASIIVSLTYKQFDTKILPLSFSVLVLVLSLVQLAIETTRKQQPGGKSSEHAGGLTKRNIRPYISAATWILGFIAGIYLVGFMIAIPLFLLVYIKQHGRSWISAIATAVVSTALLYLIFVVAFQVELYGGLFFE